VNATMTIFSVVFYDSLKTCLIVVLKFDLNLTVW
jgi:hypothetical protein